MQHAVASRKSTMAAFFDIQAPFDNVETASAYRVAKSSARVVSSFPVHRAREANARLNLVFLDRVPLSLQIGRAGVVASTEEQIEPHCHLQHFFGVAS